jgi:hypothetical protein
MKLIVSSLTAAAVALGATLVQSPQGVETLIEEYEQAEEEWRERLRDAAPAERREMRENTPAAAYWDRFQAAADAGEGRALLWMATHLREKGLGTRQIKTETPRLYGELFARHVAEDWFAEALTALDGDRRYFEQAELVRLYEQTVRDNELEDIRAQAMYQLGMYLLAADDAASNQAGTKWLQRASDELGRTAHGMMARSELTRPVIGRPAPDFTGTTIDGYEFKLSDYKGKVVLLDFYGFW